MAQEDNEAAALHNVTSASCVIPHHVGVHQAAALLELAIGTCHAEGVPVTVTHHIAVEFHAVSQEAVPVTFVITPLAGVPRAGVTSVGDVALTRPPVPVEVAPHKVSTIAATVVSSRTVLAAAVIVAVSGTPVEAVVLPINWSCARLAILARVTALLAIVVELVLLPVPSKLEPVEVTSPVRVPIVLAVARVLAVVALPDNAPVNVVAARLLVDEL